MPSSKAFSAAAVERQIVELIAVDLIFDFGDWEKSAEGF